MNISRRGFLKAAGAVAAFAFHRPSASAGEGEPQKSL
ncbi:MAG: twin-arginine translocation signal domain-containing protein, partial [Xanthomonadales bacterium]|nr:twin-arginine translocation signal domain-containing protein [Xanthomonadales bacterium]NIO13999.1 twin-arginine translocation signal domain-containing protein [Xanthomonadales bacterium]NIQ23708.1 twin-arginine translocation signal domain-containing protein [Stutzerimonas stutzeri]NIS57878.1 twin-arginine translocation signal domain-containing protein [Stutzerimonas stutzeri]